MSSFDLAEGEEVILRTNLKKDRWMRYRCATCSIRWASTVYLAPLCVPLYAIFGVSCREEEADSFELILTNQNIHFRQKIYGCGFCCQETQSKVIPLNRIQDISLISDWIGDKCGVVDTPGEVYQIHVQTAAMGMMLPELCVVCIENPRDFKKKVMDAKNRLATGEAGVGQAKLQQLLAANTNQADLQRVLALLERQNGPQQQ